MVKEIMKGCRCKKKKKLSSIHGFKSDMKHLRKDHKHLSECHDFSMKITYEPGHDLKLLSM